MSALNRKKVLGKALDFDGTNEYVDMGNVLNHERTDTFSVSMWIKHGSTANNITLFCKGDDDETHIGYFIPYIFAGEYLVVELVSSTITNNFISKRFNKKLDAGTWYHILMTYSGSSTAAGVKMYVDGVEIVDTQVDKDTLTATMINTHPFQIAARNNTLPFDGIIDEVAMWAEELTANDVSDLYAGGAGLYIDPAIDWKTDGGSMGTNLQALWHLDEGAGSSAADSSGNGLTGTLTNMEEGDWVTGKIKVPAKRKIKHHTPQLLRK